jgi:hypothetical protein
MRAEEFDRKFDADVVPKVLYAPSGTSPGRSGPSGAVWLMS